MLQLPAPTLPPSPNFTITRRKFSNYAIKTLKAVIAGKIPSALDQTIELL